MENGPVGIGESSGWEIREESQKNCFSKERFNPAFSAPLSHLIRQHDLCQTVLIFRVGVLQIRVGLLKFGLSSSLAPICTGPVPIAHKPTRAPAVPELGDSGLAFQFCLSANTSSTLPWGQGGACGLCLLSAGEEKGTGARGAPVPEVGH